MTAPLIPENPTYKLAPLERRVVGMLAVWGLWSNTAIGRAYGIDRGCVSRHGARMRAALQDLTSCCPHSPEDDL